MTQPLALVTGVSGQDGALICDFLLRKGYRVVGASRNLEQPFERLQALGIKDAVELIQADFALQNDADAVLQAYTPEEVYNLAAQSSLTVAQDRPLETAEATAMAPLRLFDAVRRLSPRTRVFQASSGQVFGDAVLESYSPAGPFSPTNLYGATKLFAQNSAEFYRRAYGLFIACGILFAHESRLRGPEFLFRKVTATLVRMAQGGDEVLSVGSLSSERDWGYAPDFVEGMWLTLQAQKPDTYVFATEQMHSVRQVIETSAAALGFDLVWHGEGLEEIGVDARTERQIVRIDPAFFRAFEDRTPPADASRARSVLGWSPSVSFEALCAEMCRDEAAE